MSRTFRRTAFFAAMALLAAAPAFAEEKTPAEPAVQAPAASPSRQCAVLFGGGSPNVSVEGQQAGRVGDGICVEVIDGARSVFTNGRPTLRVGDRVRCPDGRIGVIEGGAASVFIEGRPAATARSKVVGCD